MEDGDPLEKALPSLNSLLAGIQVSVDYDIVIYHGPGRAYHLTSPGGRLKWEKVPDSKATPKPGRWSRICIDAEASMRLELSQNDEQTLAKMEAQGKVQVVGDTQQFEQFKKELRPHTNRIDQVVRQAVGQENAEIREFWQNFFQDQKDYKEWADGPARRLLTQKPEDIEIPEKRAPLVCDLQRWILFSASSTMNGNVGQSNYTAGNSWLDGFTWQKRQQSFSLDTTIMWGAIAGIGMRWKAFASQDMLNADPNALFSVKDTQKMLWCIAIRQAPQEWVCCSTFNMSTPPPGPSQGGGYIDDGIDDLYPDDKINDHVISKGPLDILLESVQKDCQSVDQIREAVEGERVCLDGWKVRTEFNGLHGTLVRQMRDGKWRVRLDDNMGDRILNEKYFKVASQDNTTAPAVNQHCSESDAEQQSNHWGSAESSASEGSEVPIKLPVQQQAIRAVLKAARPEWDDLDLQKLLKLLDRIRIDSVSELQSACMCTIDGFGSSLNDRMEAIGEKCFAAELLCSIRKAAESHGSICCSASGGSQLSTNVESDSTIGSDSGLMDDQDTCNHSVLTRFLLAAVPSWKIDQTNMITAKLSRVNIGSVSDLLVCLSPRAELLLNDLLKHAGEYSLTEKVISALKQQAELYKAPLKAFLQGARPTWTEKDIEGVQFKLARVHVDCVTELLLYIRTEEESENHFPEKCSKVLNEKLKAEGEKAFSAATLQQLRQYAKQNDFPPQEDVRIQCPYPERSAEGNDLRIISEKSIRSAKTLRAFSPTAST